MASPQVSLWAESTVRPAEMTVTVTVIVPHPWPGTQPWSCGTTTGFPMLNAPVSGAVGADQYVLCSTTGNRSPTCTDSVRPLSLSVSPSLPIVFGGVADATGALVPPTVVTGTV